MAKHTRTLTAARLTIAVLASFTFACNSTIGSTKPPSGDSGGATQTNVTGGNSSSTSNGGNSSGGQTANCTPVTCETAKVSCGTVDNCGTTLDCGACPQSGSSWCSVASWPNGGVPDANRDVVIPSGVEILIDCNATAKSLTISAGAKVVVSRSTSSTLSLFGNLLVLGELDYGTPEDRVRAGTTAEIIFAGMNDDNYVGTSDNPIGNGSQRQPSELTKMSVLATDIGIWVMGSGKFKAAGVKKDAWGKLLEAAAPSDPNFKVESAAGWAVGDKVVLTPTAMRSVNGYTSQFDESSISAIKDSNVTLAGAPKFEHLGCENCVRRSEAANLTRNVVVRSKDDTAHAHIMVAEKGVLQVDSVEFRWLGPEKCGGPSRRAAIYFHQQESNAVGSFVRHSSIWGGGRGSLSIERTHNIEVLDVAAYDSNDSAFDMFFASTGCGTRCTDKETSNPKGVIFDHVLAAKIGAPKRDDCNRISHRLAGVVHSGGEGSGARRSVAVGIGYNGTGADIAGFQWAENGAHPEVLTFDDNVTHNSNAHGMLMWQNTSQNTVFKNNAAWSNAKMGIHWGAYGNNYTLDNFVAVDNGDVSLGLKAVPQNPDARMNLATVDDLRVLAYVLPQRDHLLLNNITFTGAKPIGVTQVGDPCTDGNSDDPNDPNCLRALLRFVNPKFPKGVKPFVFADSINRYAEWDVKGFSSADYPTLPQNFTLYRRENQVAGGCYFADFDAWMVPCPN